MPIISTDNLPASGFRKLRFGVVVAEIATFAVARLRQNSIFDIDNYLLIGIFCATVKACVVCSYPAQAILIIGVVSARLLRTYGIVSKLFHVPMLDVRSGIA